MFSILYCSKKKTKSTALLILMSWHHILHIIPNYFKLALTSYIKYSSGCPNRYMYIFVWFFCRTTYTYVIERNLNEIHLWLIYAVGIYIASLPDASYTYMHCYLICCFECINFYLQTILIPANMGERWREADNAWFKGGKGRGSGRPPDPQIKINTSQREVPTKFKEASANMQASIQKHVSNYESSSEEEDLEEAQIIGILKIEICIVFIFSCVLFYFLYILYFQLCFILFFIYIFRFCYRWLYQWRHCGFGKN